MGTNLLQAAKHALEFIESIDGYSNSKTANELRQSIEAVEQLRAVDGAVCAACGGALGIHDTLCDECLGI